MQKSLEILVIDHDRDVAEGLADVLELSGHKVHLAYGSEKASDLFRQYDFDICFVNIKLPGVSGIESFMEFRKLKPSAEVIMMTGHTVDQLAAQAADGSPVKVLRTPITVDSVLKALGDVKPSGIVLVDEASPEFCTELQEILQQEGTRFFQAGTEAEALEAIPGGGYEVLLFDVEMRMIRGLETYLNLKRQRCCLPTVVFNRLASTETVASTARDDFSETGIFFKPFDPAQMLKTLEHISTAETPLPAGTLATEKAAPEVATQHSSQPAPAWPTAEEATQSAPIPAVEPPVAEMPLAEPPLAEPPLAEPMTDHGAAMNVGGAGEWIGRADADDSDIGHGEADANSFTGQQSGWSSPEPDQPAAPESAAPDSPVTAPDESGAPDVMLGTPPSEGDPIPDGQQATGISDPAPAPVFETAPTEDDGFWDVPLGEDWVQEPSDTTPRIEHEPIPYEATPEDARAPASIHVETADSHDGDTPPVLTPENEGEAAGSFGHLPPAPDPDQTGAVEQLDESRQDLDQIAPWDPTAESDDLWSKDPVSELALPDSGAPSSEIELEALPPEMERLPETPAMESLPETPAMERLPETPAMERLPETPAMEPAVDLEDDEEDAVVLGGTDSIPRIAVPFDPAAEELIDWTKMAPERIPEAAAPIEPTEPSPPEPLEPSVTVQDEAPSAVPIEPAEPSPPEPLEPSVAARDEAFPSENPAAPAEPVDQSAPELSDLASPSEEEVQFSEGPAAPADPVEPSSPELPEAPSAAQDEALSSEGSAAPPSHLEPDQLAASLTSLDVETRVLVIDDDRDMAQGLAEILEDSGLTVQVAHSTDEAIEAAGNFDAQIALVDIQLGRNSGLDLISHLRALRPNIIPVMVTAQTDQKSAIEALREGAFDYLNKPLHPQELLAALDRCFDKMSKEPTPVMEGGPPDDESGSSGEPSPEFLANLSHKLRTPLNAVVGFSEIMSEQMLGPLGSDQYRHYAEDINQAGKLLKSAIDDFTSIDKSAAGKVELYEEQVDLSRVIFECLTRIQPAVDAGNLTIDINVAEIPVFLDGDSHKLSQVLLSLLTNAIKFTPQQGHIGFNLSRDLTGDLIIQVRDTGVGIAEEQIAKALAPVIEGDGDLDPGYEGSGLGLPLANSMVELHGGQLTLDSQVGVGTVATVRLPAHRSVAPPQADAV